ncbi:MAG: hypothetical protein ACKOGA_19475 [Planctomycetaceae bacterium]
MHRKTMVGLLACLSLLLGVMAGAPTRAHAAPVGQPYDWGRFYYYPYVYYPHNFRAPVQYNNLYYRYPQERQIPVFNSNWHNFYLMPKPWYKGHNDVLDVF